MFKTVRFLAVLLAVALAATASAQVGTPGIGYPPAGVGQSFTGSMKAPSGCTTPGYSFTSDTDSGLCLFAANIVRLQTAPLGTVSSSYLNLATTSASLNFYDAGGLDGAITFGNDSAAIASAGATQFLVNGSTDFTFGDSTKDPIKITPVAKGAGAFAGNITTRDLTGAQTYYLPDGTGDVYVLGASYLGAGTKSFVSAFDVTTPQKIETLTDGASQISVLSMTGAESYLQSSLAAAGVGKVDLMPTTAGLSWTLGGNSTSITLNPTNWQIYHQVGAGFWNLALDETTGLSYQDSAVVAGNAFNVGGSTGFTVVDPINIKPVAKGAGAFAGNITTDDLTATSTWTFPNASAKVGLNNVRPITIPDSGGAGAAAYTLNVTPNVQKEIVIFTCSDADGCDVTMGETSIADGQTVQIVNVSANTVAFADTAGVSETAGAFSAGQYDTITLMYAGATWIEVSRSNN